MLRGSILQTLVDTCRERTHQTPFNYGVYYKNTLVSLCHALEDSILSNDSQPIVLTAFQRGKWYLQELCFENDTEDRQCGWLNLQV